MKSIKDDTHLSYSLKSYIECYENNTASKIIKTCSFY